MFILLFTFLLIVMIVIIIFFVQRALKYYDLCVNQQQKIEEALDELDRVYKSLFFEYKNNVVLVNDPVVMQFIKGMKSARETIVNVSRKIANQEKV